MLRLIGMYIPFVLVILGIGACSFIYKDNLLGTFGQQEEVIEPVPEPEVPMDEITPIEEEPVDAVEVESNEEPLSTDALPGIGECVCPDQSTTTLEGEEESSK